jgi:hypothetical protein
VKNFHLLDRINVSEAVRQLDAHPELWNQHRHRKDAPGSPHNQMDDIWLRYRAFQELREPADYLKPHFAEFYPAWHELPAIRTIVRRVFVSVPAVYLGGVLITRIPPGGKILPHHDRGGWHAETMNYKVYVPLKANPECVNRCEDESVVMKPGEVWTFDNLKVHSVENNGETERVTLIISMRAERW